MELDLCIIDLCLSAYLRTSVQQLQGPNDCAGAASSDHPVESNGKENGEWNGNRPWGL